MLLFLFLIFNSESFLINIYIYTQVYLNEIWRKVYVVFISVKFPNNTLDLTIYNGVQAIHEIYLIKCKIDRILPEDFDNSRSMLHALKTLRFSQCQFLNISSKTLFFVKNRLEEIEFYDSDIIHLDPDFFNLHNGILKRLHIDKLPMEFSLNDILKPNFKSPLIYIGITTFAPKFQSLTAYNFSALRRIEDIVLQHCGIQYIESDTFNHLNKTLCYIDLSNNKLIAVDYRMFYKFIKPVPDSLFTLDLRNNLLMCNCAFYELYSIYRWILESFDSVSMTLSCFHDVQTQMNFMICNDVQAMDLNKFNITRAKVRTQNYPKFMVRFSEATQTIVVTTSTSRKYRLWTQNIMYFSNINPIWNQSFQACPSDSFVRSSIQCHSLSNSIENIPFSKFSSGPIVILLCISYVTLNPGKVWPYHCITVNRIKPIPGRADYTCFVFGAIAGLLAFFITIGMCGRNHAIKGVMENKRNEQIFAKFEIKSIPFCDADIYESISQINYCNSYLSLYDEI